MCISFVLVSTRLKKKKKKTNRFVMNLSVSLSPILVINEKVEHYIKIKTHTLIILRFWVKSGVNILCDWTQISLVLYLPSITRIRYWILILRTKNIFEPSHC